MFLNFQKRKEKNPCHLPNLRLFIRYNFLFRTSLLVYTSRRHCPYFPRPKVQLQKHIEKGNSEVLYPHLTKDLQTKFLSNISYAKPNKVDLTAWLLERDRNAGRAGLMMVDLLRSGPQKKKILFQYKRSYFQHLWK